MLHMYCMAVVSVQSPAAAVPRDDAVEHAATANRQLAVQRHAASSVSPRPAVPIRGRQYTHRAKPAGA